MADIGMKIPQSVIPDIRNRESTVCLVSWSPSVIPAGF